MSDAKRFYTTWNSLSSKVVLISPSAMKRGLDGSEQDLDAILKSLTKAPDHQYGSSALPILSVITYVLGHV